MKTADLTSAELDYWVAKAEGLEVTGWTWDEGGQFNRMRTSPSDRRAQLANGDFVPAYSTDWVHGGPIMEREGISLITTSLGGLYEWRAEIGVVHHAMSGDPIPDGSGRGATGLGPTALIAAMRALVSSKYGEEVPDEDRA